MALSSTQKIRLKTIKRRKTSKKIFLNYWVKVKEHIRYIRTPSLKILEDKTQDPWNPNNPHCRKLFLTHSSLVALTRFLIRKRKKPAFSYKMTICWWERLLELCMCLTKRLKCYMELTNKMAKIFLTTQLPASMDIPIERNTLLLDFKKAKLH